MRADGSVVSEGSPHGKNRQVLFRDEEADSMADPLPPPPLTGWQSESWRKGAAAGAIMVTLVIYGLVQERIMTQPYGPRNEYFKNAAYLVFNNRIVAMGIALIMMYRTGESIRPAAPLPNFFGISISNTLSTLCQYEALKYVSFPTQTLGKCGKMIPVMVLGVIVSAKKYLFIDYAVATVVTAGCAMFILTGEVSASEKADSTYGLVLMGGYLFSDAFTSTFQEKLFRGYKMSTYNQMLYVNFCSAILSIIALAYQGELMTGIYFSLENTDFLVNSLMLSLAASLGQLAIYYTIKNFGALFFATVMTVRQVISIVVSCVVYLHPLSWGQIISAGLVFAVLYWKDTQKSHSHGHGSAPPAAPTSPSHNNKQLVAELATGDIESGDLKKGGN